MKKMMRAAMLAFDIAFLGRMGAGFAGDVDRHTAIIEPVLNSIATPATLYGTCVIDDLANGMRPLAAADSGVTVVDGIVVRPFPTNAPAGSTNAQQGLGSAAVPTGIMAILKQGYVAVQMNTGAGAVVKGGAVFVWVAATVAGHVQGQFESAANGGNTAALDVNRYGYNGPADANGIVELSFNL